MMSCDIRAKVAWVEGGEKGPEPNFTDYAERTQKAWPR